MQKYGTDGLPVPIMGGFLFFPFVFPFFYGPFPFTLEFPVNSVSIDKDEN